MSKQKKILSQEILMFQQVMEGLRRGLSQESLFKLIIHSVRKGLGFKRCGIFLLEPNGRHVRLALGIDKRGHFEKNKDRIPIQKKAKGLNLFYDLINGRKKYFLCNN